MKCFKCLIPTLQGVVITDDITGDKAHLCATCTNIFINKLSEWKDFELSEEINHFLGRKPE